MSSTDHLFLPSLSPDTAIDTLHLSTGLTALLQRGAARARIEAHVENVLSINPLTLAFRNRGTQRAFRAEAIQTRSSASLVFLIIELASQISEASNARIGGRTAVFVTFSAGALVAAIILCLEIRNLFLLWWIQHLSSRPRQSVDATQTHNQTFSTTLTGAHQRNGEERKGIYDTSTRSGTAARSLYHTAVITDVIGALYTLLLLMTFLVGSLSENRFSGCVSGVQALEQSSEASRLFYCQHLIRESLASPIAFSLILRSPPFPVAALGSVAAVVLMALRAFAFTGDGSASRAHRAFQFLLLVVVAVVHVAVRWVVDQSLLRAFAERRRAAMRAAELRFEGDALQSYVREQLPRIRSRTTSSSTTTGGGRASTTSTTSVAASSNNSSHNNAASGRCSVTSLLSRLLATRDYARQAVVLAVGIERYAEYSTRVMPHLSALAAAKAMAGIHEAVCPSHAHAHHRPARSGSGESSSSAIEPDVTERRGDTYVAVYGLLHGHSDASAQGRALDAARAIARAVTIETALAECATSAICPPQPPLLYALHAGPVVGEVPAQSALSERYCMDGPGIRAAVAILGCCESADGSIVVSEAAVSILGSAVADIEDRDTPLLVEVAACGHHALPTSTTPPMPSPPTIVCYRSVLIQLQHGTSTTTHADDDHHADREQDDHDLVTSPTEPLDPINDTHQEPPPPLAAPPAGLPLEALPAADVPSPLATLFPIAGHPATATATDTATSPPPPPHPLTHSADSTRKVLTGMGSTLGESAALSTSTVAGASISQARLSLLLAATTTRVEVASNVLSRCSKQAQRLQRGMATEQQTALRLDDVSFCGGNTSVLSQQSTGPRRRTSHSGNSGDARGTEGIFSGEDGGGGGGCCCCTGASVRPQCFREPRTEHAFREHYLRHGRLRLVHRALDLLFIGLGAVALMDFFIGAGFWDHDAARLAGRPQETSLSTPKHMAGVVLVVLWLLWTVGATAVRWRAMPRAFSTRSSPTTSVGVVPAMRRLWARALLSHSLRATLGIVFVMLLQPSALGMNPVYVFLTVLVAFFVDTVPRTHVLPRLLARHLLPVAAVWIIAGLQPLYMLEAFLVVLLLLWSLAAVVARLALDRRDRAAFIAERTIAAAVVALDSQARLRGTVLEGSAPPALRALFEHIKAASSESAACALDQEAENNVPPPTTTERAAAAASVADDTQAAVMARSVTTPLNLPVVDYARLRVAAGGLPAAVVQLDFVAMVRLRFDPSAGPVGARAGWGAEGEGCSPDDAAAMWAVASLIDMAAFFRLVDEALLRHPPLAVIEVRGAELTLGGPWTRSSSSHTPHDGVTAERCAAAIVAFLADLSHCVRVAVAPSRASYTFSAIAGADEAILLTRNPLYPSFDLLGTGPLRACALLRAAPAGTVAVTEGFRRCLLLQGGMGSAAHSESLPLAPQSAPWCVRGIPVTRMYSLTPL